MNLFFLLALGPTLARPAPTIGTTAPDSGWDVSPPVSFPIAFVDVTVVPMTADTVLPHYTVIVDRDRIIAVGPRDRLVVPRGAQIIDGHGRFLLPGLADMHVHLSDTLALEMLLANGVTTARDLDGTPQLLDWRQSIAAGQREGPELIVAAPIIYGTGKDTDSAAARARTDVASDAQIGYDLIKVYGGLSRTEMVAVGAEARRHHLPVVGHLPVRVGLAASIRAGLIEVAHAEELYTEFVPGYDRDHPPDNPVALKLVADSVPRAAEILHAGGARLVPTLVELSTVDQMMRSPAVLLAQASSAYLPVLDRAAIQAGTERHQSLARRTPAFLTFISHLLDLSKAVTRDSYLAGVPIVMGTDAGITGVVPGFTVHDELGNLVALGLPPYAALRTATVNATLDAPDGKSFGTIEVGKRADLLLVDGNPLVNVAAVRTVAGVMRRGRWYPRDAVRHMLAQVLDFTRAESSFVSTIRAIGVDRAVQRWKTNPRVGSAGLPVREKTFVMLGNALLGDGRTVDAVAAFRLAASAAPRSPRPLRGLADALVASGDTTHAVAAYRHALELDPTSSDARQALTRIGHP
jgi:imidazolonepropionase-like amidohydrolase